MVPLQGKAQRETTSRLTCGSSATRTTLSDHEDGELITKTVSSISDSDLQNQLGGACNR